MQRTVRVVPTGSVSLDKLLGGGLHSNEVVLVYGEAETGKSSLAIQCAVNAARLGFKTIFIDADGTFSPRRLGQIAGSDLNEVAPKISLVRPETFQEQALALDRLDEFLLQQMGLVVVDTVTSLYRAEMSGVKKETFNMNRELGRQLACLAQIAKTKKVATLITSQVRNVFLEGYVSVEPVATRVLRFWSDTVINLKPADHRNKVKAVLEKPVQRTGRLHCYLSIEETGICDCR